ncbi:MAG: Yip1 family protein [Caulobacter sp.]|nr:Yip1 family protein [Caulobacter sp.]
MSVVDGGGSASGLIQRVRDILTQPKPTWEVIDGEAATIKGLFTGYVAILAALPAIAGILAAGFLAPMMGRFAAFGPVGAIVSAVIGYGLTLVGVYVFAIVVDALAPSFGGVANRVQALKGVAYGGTASWIGGGLSFVPVLGWLIAFAGGLYSLYLLFLGLPKMMKVPEDKALGFVLVSLVVVVVIQVVIAWIVGMTIMLAGFGVAGAAGMGHFMMR